MLLVLAGAGASLLMLWITTTYGLGISPDSLVYIETAKSVLAGHGFFAGGLDVVNTRRGTPMTHFPPAYPLLLAVAGLCADGDVLQGGRLLHALLFGVNSVLIGMAVHRCTQGGWVTAGCAILPFLASSPNLFAHAMAWSEAPFLTFALAGFILLALHIQRAHVGLLLAASVALGLATATRYVGMTLLPPLAVGLLLVGNRPLRRRLMDILLATTVACLPLGVWLIRNVMLAHTSTNRTVAFHPIGADHVKGVMLTMHDFMLAVSIPNWMKALHLLGAIGLLLLAFAILHRTNNLRLNAGAVRIILPLLCILFALTYIAVLLITVSFFDALTPLDARLLLPVFVCLIVVAVSLAWSVSQALKKPLVWWSFLVFVVLCSSINAGHTVALASNVHMNGMGYTSRNWQDSPTIAWVKSVRAAVTLYSNGADVMHFQIARDVMMIPNYLDPMTGRPNPAYHEQWQRLCNECAAGKALIVYLDHIRREYLPTPEHLTSTCNLSVVHRADDGTVYGQPGLPRGGP